MPVAIVGYVFITVVEWNEAKHEVGRIGRRQGGDGNPPQERKFLIGRASDCTLRAGSEAISRHHCLVTRVDGAVAVRDLGSRNGTHVNGEKIAAETPLNHGDLLRVGPLEFRFEAPQPVAVVAAPAAPVETAAAPAAHRRPKVTGVADVVARSAAAEKPESLEEDISRWLLEPMAPGTSMKETMSFRMDETRAVQQLSGEVEPVVEAEAEAATSDSGVSEIDPKTGKKKVGKLPTVPKAQSKDSREAAVQILRDMARGARSWRSQFNSRRDTASPLTREDGSDRVAVRLLIGFCFAFCFKFFEILLEIVKLFAQLTHRLAQSFFSSAGVAGAFTSIFLIASVAS